MTEFVTLVAIGVVVVGLGVVTAAYLLTAVGWLVVRTVRRRRPPRIGTRGSRHRSPGG
jgi:hypothetical protein